MRKLINIERLLRIDRFIRRKGSGPPNEFAKRIGISKTTLFEYLSYLRDDLMAIIHYNRYSKNYEYEKEPEFLQEYLNNEQSEAIEGGNTCDCDKCPRIDCPRRNQK